jgi:hypothetical protein
MVSFARIAFPFGEDSMMEWLYGKKVFGVQLFVTCSLLLLAALSVAGAQVADVTPKFDGVHVDALDADAWNGVVFAARAFRQPSDFAFRFGSFSQTFIDGPAIFDAVREVGPHAPVASYCRMSWAVPPRKALITLEWSRIDQTTVVGAITGDSPISRFFLKLIFLWRQVHGVCRVCIRRWTRPNRRLWANATSTVFSESPANLW